MNTIEKVPRRVALEFAQYITFKSASNRSRRLSGSALGLETQGNLNLASTLEKGCPHHVEVVGPARPYREEEAVS